MALPGKQSSKSRKRGRVSLLKQKGVSLSVCPKCKKPIRPHHACAFCGTYRGRTVLEIKTKLKTPKKKREAEQEAKDQKKQEKQEEKKR